MNELLYVFMLVFWFLAVLYVVLGARPRGVGASSSPLVPVTRSAQVDDGGDEMDNLGDWLGMREVLTEEFKKRLLELNENDDI